MIGYATLKFIHVALAFASVAGFLARAVPALRHDRRWTESRWLHALPHVVDTLLVASGVWIAVSVGWNPVAHPWFGTKLALIVAYIVLGWFALRPGRPRAVRIALLVAALAVFGWIVATARTKLPLPL